MLREKRILIVGVTSLVLLAGLFVVFNGQGQSNRQTPATTNEVPFGQGAKQLDDAAAPIVDFDNPNRVDRIDKNARKLKNARYDKYGVVPSNPHPHIGEIIGWPERRAGFSDLPTDRSVVIAEALVGNSQAFLSEDKTDSEFTILVAKVLKAAPGLILNAGDMIVAERFGGRVRYPSGKLIRCRVEGEGVPIVGKRYVFFLAKADQDSYALLTAYEIQNNKVFALDGTRTAPRGQGHSIFDKHNGEAFDSFMAEIETAINRSRVGGAKP